MGRFHRVHVFSKSEVTGQLILFQAVWLVVLASNCFCFPSAARISLENGKEITMSQLRIGDSIEAGTLNLFHQTEINNKSRFNSFFPLPQTISRCGMQSYNVQIDLDLLSVIYLF